MLELNEINNPFPGIRPFEMDETNLFFGRDGQSDELLKRMQLTRLLAVVGTSGSGKSSLIRAGLLPALYGGLMGDAGSSWRIAIQRPGGDPIGNLATALADPLVFGSENNSEIQTALIETTLRRSSIGLIDVAREARMSPHENLLIVVDQFEELFRFNQSQTNDDATTFVKLLLEASAQRDLPIYIIITMRSDFLGDCSRFTGLPEAINNGQYLIPRMSRDERQSAIVGPIAVGEGSISAPLVSRLLNDVGDNPDQLPILQHALMRTWDYWATHRLNGDPIDLDDYTAIGTMTEALSRHADEAFNGLPDERSRLIAEKLFKRLTEKGTDNREIRRPTALAELAVVCGASEDEVKAVIEAFRGEGRSFLMPPVGTKLTSEKIIDISHESLIRNWTRLQKWVDEESQAGRIYHRLAETAALHREGSEGLLQDPGLQIALDWIEKTKPNAAWAKRYNPEFDEATKYLVESCEAREEAQRERERQRNAALERERRDREQAQVYAQQQLRTARRLRWLSLGMAVMFVLALATAAYALVARKRAKTSEESAKISEGTAKANAERAVKLQERAEGLQQAADKQREDAERARDAAKEIAKSLEIEKENLRIEQQKTKVALKKAEIAVIAADNAQRGMQAALFAAHVQAEETQKAVDRGVLIRNAMEDFQREEYEAAFKKFSDLRTQLEKLQPKVAASDARESLPEKDRQFVRDLSWANAHIGATRLAEDTFNPPEAVTAYNAALRELEKLPANDKVRTDRQMFDIYHGLGRANQLFRTLDPKEMQQARSDAELYLKKALEFQQGRARELREAAKPVSDETLQASVQKQEDEVADSYRDLAVLYRDLERGEDAERYFKLAAETREKAQWEPKAILEALKELAEFYFDGNRFTEAADTYNHLIDIQDRNVSVNETHDLSDSYTNLARVYSARKDESAKANLAFKVASLLQQIQLAYRKYDLGKEDLTLEKDLTLKLDQLGDTYVQLDRFVQAKETFGLGRDIRLVGAGASEVWRSYEKLGNMYFNQITDKASAAKLSQSEYKEAYDNATDNYSMLVQSFQPPPTNDRVLKAKYGDGLERLGRLYTLDPETYVGAEEKLTKALRVRRELGDWKGEDSTFTALADLFQRQKNETKVEGTYRDRLVDFEKYMKVFDPPPNTPVSTRATASTGFLGTYVRNIADAGDYYLSRKMNAQAEAAYAQALSHAPLIRNRAFDQKVLESFATALEQYEKLLREAGKTVDAAKIKPVIDSVHEKIDSEKTRQQQQQAQQSQSSQAP